MSTLTGLLVLPPSVRIVPIASLSAEVRAALGGEEGSAALTDAGSRTPSRLVDRDTARLLEEFREPCSIVEAVLRFSRVEPARNLDPDSILQAAFEPLSHLVADGFLVEPDSIEARGTASTFCRGMLWGPFEVLDVCQATEDLELLQVRGRRGIAALKVERPRSEGRGAPAQPLSYEAAVLEQLGGELGPRLVERGATDGRSWLALEWIRGTDAETFARELRSMERPGGPDRAALWALGRDLLDLYAGLHERGVVHGDVQPRNVLVSGAGVPRLLDFGASAWEGAPGDLVAPARGGLGFFYEPECASAILSGAAPEPPTPLGEQYLVAALLDLLLTGDPYRPFALSREGLLRQIVDESPRSFAERQVEPWPEIEEVLLRALRKAPSERFPSVRALADAWRAAEPATEMTSVAVGRSVNGSELLQRTFERLRSAGAPAFEPIPAAPSASLHFGAAGRAGALLQMARSRGEAELLSLADVWLSVAARQAAAPSAWFAEAWGLNAENVHPYSPFYGASGLPFVEAGQALTLGEPEIAAAAISRFTAPIRGSLAAPETALEMDLVLGLSGALLAICHLLPAAPAESRDDLATLGEALCLRIRDELAARPPVGEDPQLRSLGIAHGWAGRLYAALRWCRAAAQPLPASLAARLHQLAALGEPWGRGLRWRCFGAGGRDLGALTGWCNGSAGLTFLWEEALLQLADVRFAALAEGAAWHAWEGPDEGFDLCCGIAGRSYALLALFRRTGDPRWLTRARALAERAARQALRHDDAPDSLFKGGLGVAVLQVDLERPETAAFPFFEEER